MIAVPAPVAHCMNHLSFQMNQFRIKKSDKEDSNEVLQTLAAIVEAQKAQKKEQDDKIEKPMYLHLCLNYKASKVPLESLHIILSCSICYKIHVKCTGDSPSGWTMHYKIYSTQQFTK